jgi:hypothetical protein
MAEASSPWRGKVRRLAHGSRRCGCERIFPRRMPDLRPAADGSEPRSHLRRLPLFVYSGAWDYMRGLRAAFGCVDAEARGGVTLPRLRGQDLSLRPRARLCRVCRRAGGRDSAVQIPSRSRRSGRGSRSEWRKWFAVKEVRWLGTWWCQYRYIASENANARTTRRPCSPGPRRNGSI